VHQELDYPDVRKGRARPTPERGGVDRFQRPRRGKRLPQLSRGPLEGRERIVDGRVDTALERLYRKLTDNVA